MFLDELTPFVQELTRQPVAFLGGLVSGLLRIDLTEEPVKGWLANQDVAPVGQGESENGTNSNSGPQKISID